MIVALVELTCVLALAWAFDRVTVTRLRPQVRHALWTLVAVRAMLPAGLPGLAPATVPVDAAYVGGLADVLERGPGVWIPAAWALGAALFLLQSIRRSLTAGGRLRRLDGGRDAADAALVSTARAAADRVGLRRAPAVFIDPGAASPYVTGLWSPKLVLPAAWREPRVVLEHALAHELVHIARRDLLGEAVWLLIACVYWFHPLAHVARRRAHEAREMCCDADAARRLGPDYRVTLLHALAAHAGERAPAGLPAGHGWHPVIARLHALDRWPHPPGWPHRLAFAATVLAAAVIVLPGHVATVPGPARIAPEALLDSATRQELGMGSLHLRYAIMAEAARHQREKEGGE